MREGWKEVRLKDVLGSPLQYGINEAVEDDNPENPRFIRITDLNDNDTLKEDTFKSIPMENAIGYLLKNGDILMARSGATAGKTFLYNQEIGQACFAGYLIRASLNKEIANFRFISHLTRSNYYDNWKNRVNIQATIQNISAEKYNQFNFPLPPLSTQHAIADYLDEKLAVIDRNITLLEQKRDRYTALRKSLINQAVRCGLSSLSCGEGQGERLKDSGIEWLGNIPKHWEVKRVKDVTYIRKGKLLETVDEQLSGYKPLLSLDYLRNNAPQFENFVFTEDKELHVAENDIIVVWDGAGSGDILKGKEGILSSTIAKISMNKKIIQTKFFYFLRFNLEYKLKSQPTGMGIPHINSNVLKEFEIPIPPLSEQRAIADYLDKQSGKIDRIVENINAQLGKLAQLKKSLINECVTGEREVDG